MFNVENRYSKQSDSQNAKIIVYKFKIKQQNVQMRNKRQFWAMKPVLRLIECIHLAKHFSKQKIGFWGNLGHLGESLLSNALNSDNLPPKQN